MNFQTLSVFVECSTGCVPKIAYLKQFASLIAKMGYNAMYLGTSDTLQVEGEPYFGYLRGGYSQEEIHELDDYCKGIGMELRPALQTLAKFHRLGAYEAYHGYMDIGDILLVGEEKVYDLLDKIFATCAKFYTSRTIHIGMDEAFLLGVGAYMAKHGLVSKQKIMLEHIQRVAQIAKKYGFQCEMWSDMFFRALNGDTGSAYESGVVDPATILQGLPDNVTIVYWDYVTNNLQACEKKIEQHLSITDRVAFTGAIWKFMGFAPDNRFSISVADTAIEACKNKGIQHFQISLWADTHGECSLYSVLPSLFYYAEKAQGKAEIDRQKYFEIVGCDYDLLLKTDELNDPHKKRYTTLNNKSFYYLYQDVLLGEFDSMLSEGIGDAYQRLAEEFLPLTQGAYGYVFATLQSLAECLAVKAELGKNVWNAYKAGDKQRIQSLANDIDRLLISLDALSKNFTAQWENENKSFGFEIHLIRLGGLQARLRYVQEKLRKFANGEMAKIEELEIERQPFGKLRSAKEDDFMYTGWNTIVSVN